MNPIVLLWLFACTEIERPILWEGYVFLQGDEGMVPLEDATVSLLDQHGALLQTGLVPTGRPSHYQQFTMEYTWLDTPVFMRIENADSFPLLWNGTSPSMASTWLPGGLFALEKDFGTKFFQTFAETVEVDLVDGVHLWGEPLRREEWIDVDIRLFDEQQDYTVYTFSQLPNGLISTSTETGIDWFFAWNLPSHPLTLSITTANGEVIETTYTPSDGDILSALYYALPTNED